MAEVKGRAGHDAAAQGEHQAVRHKFERLKRSGEERWNVLAAGLEVAWNELSA